MSDGTSGNHRHFYAAVAVLSILGAVGAAWLLYNAPRVPQSGEWKARLAFAAYAIIPPVWFFFEFYRYGKQYSGDKLATYIQVIESARAVWLGVGAALVVMYKLGA